MKHTPSRRSVLSLAGAVSLPLLSGCFGMDDDPTPGSFRLENEDTETHTARVRVDGEQRAQFTLETGRWWEEEDFLTEAGRHRVAIELESGEFEGVRADIRESSASSVGRTGDAILGTITSGGGLSVGVGVYD